MQIVSIRPSRHPHIVWVTFADKKFLPLMVDEVYRLKIKKGDDLTGDHLNNLYRLSFYQSLFDYALRQIGLSPKIKSVLIPKLKPKLRLLNQKYSPPQQFPELIDEVITKISEKNLLDEQSYVESLVRKYSHKSVQYLKRLLQSQGLSPTKYSHLFNTSAEASKINQLLVKFKPTPETITKVISKLIYRGFAYSDIKTAIDEYLKNR